MTIESFYSICNKVTSEVSNECLRILKLSDIHDYLRKLNPQVMKTRSTSQANAL